MAGGAPTYRLLVMATTTRSWSTATRRRCPTLGRRWQPHGVHGASPGLRPRPVRAGPTPAGAGVALPGPVVYELHVGTFTAGGHARRGASTRLDHLVDLGVDLVELMPVAAFPGRHGWGYDGVHLYAVHEPYGGPDALKRFVDACHARGLGRLPRRRLQPPRARRATTCRASAPTSPTGTTRRGARRSTSTTRAAAEVRRWIIDNALMWLRDYHLDALRLDAVHALADDSRRAPAGRAVARGRRAGLRSAPAAVPGRRVRPQPARRP